MSFNSQDQNFESYVPVYDTVPEKWEEAREFLVENLKKISNAINIREIGWFLDEEILSGKQFFPSTTAGTGESTQYRSILRKVVNFSPLVAGANTQAHDIIFDTNFSLINLYAAATNTGTLTAQPIPNGADTISMDSTNITITVAAGWTRAYAVVEYIQET